MKYEKALNIIHTDVEIVQKKVVDVFLNTPKLIYSQVETNTFFNYSRR